MKLSLSLETLLEEELDDNEEGGGKVRKKIKVQ